MSVHVTAGEAPRAATARYFGFVARRDIVGRATRVVLSFNPQRHQAPRTDRFLTPLRAPQRWGAGLWRHIAPLTHTTRSAPPALRALLLGLLWGWLPGAVPARAPSPLAPVPKGLPGEAG